MKHLQWLEHDNRLILISLLNANCELIVRLLVGTLVHEDDPVKAGYNTVIYLRCQK